MIAEHLAARRPGRPAGREPRRRGRRSAATTTCSIFIASRVTTGSPASTVATDADVDGQDGARHRGDDARPGRPPRPTPCATAAAAPARSTSGGGASANGDAAAGEVDVDGVADDDGLERRGTASSSATDRVAPRPRAGRAAAPLSRQPPAHGSSLVRGAGPGEHARRRGPGRRPGSPSAPPSRRAARSGRACRSGPRRRGRPAGGRASAGTAGS